MKLPNATTALTVPLLGLVIAASAGSFAATSETRDASSQANQEAQGRVESQQPGEDKTNTPGQRACENSHAPTGSPGIAENENSQDSAAQAGNNAQVSREGNQGAQARENSRADLAQAGDDCLDVNSTLREQNEDARGQGTGNDPSERNADDQTRTP